MSGSKSQPKSLREKRGPRDIEGQRQKIKKEIKEDYKENGNYKMIKVAHKNILIIGRSRTGKSTIKSLLVDPTKIPKDLTLKADTKQAKFCSFHLQKDNVVINIIDTPGLFERSTTEVDIRDNTTILNTIGTCINMEITKFHVICFCVSLTNGINGDDIKSLEILIEYLGKKISKISCLIITHCESKSEEKRNKLKEELVQDNYFKKIAPFFELGIFFSGSINPDDFHNGNDSVIDQYCMVSEYRTQLIELFLSIKEPLPIVEIANGSTKFAKDIRDRYIAKEDQSDTHYKDDSPDDSD
ncbi:unnamed protein product [Rotaria magnacalcarata]|uniref:AIG1-type G domain-containing protein n=1 Tax=Rotaria magnacalcarata TaxID=392030 RepID=A0A815MVZ3_9BILA|nr:unnamed protein product [Rotaria magnacalcarata]